jgi:hypothetical protein
VPSAVRTIFASAVAVLLASSPAFSQPACNDDEVLQQLVTKYFGLSEYKGMTDAKIRDKIIVTPEMQHWRDMAKKNEVGEAIANWVIDIDVQATISTQYLVRSVTALQTSFEPNLALVLVSSPQPAAILSARESGKSCPSRVFAMRCPK